MFGESTMAVIAWLLTNPTSSAGSNNVGNITAVAPTRIRQMLSSRPTE